MGTRADFYVGTGPNAEWIGSISYDGYPDGTPATLLKSTNEVEFRSEVIKILSDPEILSTSPAEGWPWPWEDSRTTDYAYAWDLAEVVLSGFGRPWETLAEHMARGDDYDPPKMTKGEVCDMTKRKASSETILAKSGLMIVRSP